MAGVKVDASTTNAIAFFTEHFPTEFEATAHYLKDDTGVDVEPVAELAETASAAAPVATEDDKEDKPWGDVIGASVIICLVTLIALIYLVPFPPYRSTFNISGSVMGAKPKLNSSFTP